jgi:MFS family permease
MALYSFGFGVFGALYTLFVVDSLGFKPGVLGVIYGIGGVSSLIGAVLAARAASRFGTGPSMAIGVAMMGASISLIAVAPEAGLVATVLLIAQQVSGDGMFTVYDVNEVSLRQSITPDDMLGRVNSFTYLMENSLQLVGALAGGLLGATLGLRTTMALGSAFTVGAGALLALSPVMRVREVPAEVHPVAAEA